MTKTATDAWLEMPQIDPAWAAAQFDDRRVVFLGETNHFVHEKVEFRLAWLHALARRRPLVVGEELGWCDGRRVEDYILRGDDAALSRVATFGYTGHQRGDRDDSFHGVFGISPYPYAAMLAEHRRFYDALRATDGILGYFGFDMDSPGGAYDDLPATAGVSRVAGETISGEADRLEILLKDFDDSLARQDIAALIESLRYTAMVQFAADYEATRPAMAYREESMKRRVQWQLQRLPKDALLVLLGHAFHLAKSDAGIERRGVGPGGGTTSSLGDYITHTLGEHPGVVWMIYGGGEDCQPLADLPRVADFPEDSLNAVLRRRFRQPAVLPVTNGEVRIGHLYNQVVAVDLGAEADFLSFYPEVIPLQTGD